MEDRPQAGAARRTLDGRGARPLYGGHASLLPRLHQIVVRARHHGRAPRRADLPRHWRHPQPDGRAHRQCGDLGRLAPGHPDRIPEDVPAQRGGLPGAHRPALPARAGDQGRRGQEHAAGAGRPDGLRRDAGAVGHPALRRGCRRGAQAAGRIGQGAGARGDVRCRYRQVQARGPSGAAGAAGQQRPDDDPIPARAGRRDRRQRLPGRDRRRLRAAAHLRGRGRRAGAGDARRHLFRHPGDERAAAEAHRRTTGGADAAAQRAADAAGAAPVHHRALQRQGDGADADRRSEGGRATVPGEAGELCQARDPLAGGDPAQRSFEGRRGRPAPDQGRGPAGRRQVGRGRRHRLHGPAAVGNRRRKGRRGRFRDEGRPGQRAGAGRLQDGDHQGHQGDAGAGRRPQCGSRPDPGAAAADPGDR